jgi:hypothetical protein
MTDTHGSIVKEIAEQIAEGRLEVLINGSLFRSIHGVQSKLELVHTPNALVSLSRWDHLSAPAGLLGTVQEVSEVHAGLRSLGEDGVDLLYGSRDVPSLSELDSQRYTHGAARCAHAAEPVLPLRSEMAGPAACLWSLATESVPQIQGRVAKTLWCAL